MFATNHELIQHLKNSGVLHSGAIADALAQVDRINFVRADQKDFAYADNALPFAGGQTISQPTTVVFMLEMLDLRPGDKVLDVGAGSGWVSFLLAELAGKGGDVFAYEINQAAGKLGKMNVQKCQKRNISYEIADASKNWQQNAPYDRIYCGAAFKEIPKKLLDQLAIGGILVAPTQEGYIEKWTRASEKEFEKEGHYGFVFVPFVES